LTANLKTPTTYEEIKHLMKAAAENPELTVAHINKSLGQDFVRLLLLVFDRIEY